MSRINTSAPAPTSPAAHSAPSNEKSESGTSSITAPDWLAPPLGHPEALHSKASLTIPDANKSGIGIRSVLSHKNSHSGKVPAFEQLLLPLTFGFVLPRGEDLLRGKSFGRLSLSHVAGNYANAKDDFTLTGSSFKRDVVMHGAAGALGYLSLRVQGHSALESALGSALVGVGIELGQSLEPNHPVSMGDMVRTTAYGALFGEAMHHMTLWANEKYDETGKDIYKVLGAASYLKVLTPRPGEHISLGLSFEF